LISEASQSFNPKLGLRNNSTSKKANELQFSSQRRKTTKMLTNLERRITNVPHEEYLKKKDVTLEEKRTLSVFTALNLIAFIIQVVVVVLAQVFFPKYKLSSL